MKLKRLWTLLLFTVLFFGPYALSAQSVGSTSAQKTSQPKSKTAPKVKRRSASKSDIFSAANSPSQKTTFPEQPTDQSLISGGAPPIAVEIAVLAGLAILPWVIMMLTSYIKIVVVISLLRNALGVQQAPPNQVVNGIALILTIYIMFPTGLAMYNSAKGYIEENAPSKLVSSETATYLLGAIDRTKEPLRTFLVNNTSQGSINRFYQMAYRIFPQQFKQDLGRTDFIVLIPSYITSQLRDAFAIGVLIYLPFFVIDLVTSNILLAMGMMMLSPLTISLPLKLLLLVMVDGWTILIQGLVLTFR